MTSTNDVEHAGERSLPAGRLRVLAFQVEVPATRTAQARDAHVERMAGAIDERLRDTPADIVVLPELSSIEYSREAFAELDTIGESPEGSSSHILGEVARAHRTFLIHGIARNAGSAFHISQVAIGPDGRVLGHYDKLHVAQYGASMEKEYFARGDHLLVFEVAGWRVAPIICYDIRFPELSRALCSKHHVDLLLHCGAYFRDPSYASWHRFVATRAIENQIYVLSLNRAGAQWGGSVLCPPWIDEAHFEHPFGDEERFEHLALEPGVTAEARRTYPFLKDRLNGYAALDVHPEPLT